MASELLNLLPPERLRAWKRDYFVRLATVCVLALTVVVVGSGALLVPAYLYLGEQTEARQAYVKTLDKELADAKEKGTSQRLTALTEGATYLARLATTTTATGAFRGVLAAPRTGVTLTGFTYTSPTQGTNGRMDLKGQATTREALRAYTEALSALPFVSNVELPISAYAKERDIPFTITLTGTLRP